MRLEFESKVLFFTVKITLKINPRECQGASRAFLLLIKHAWYAVSQAITKINIRVCVHGLYVRTLLLATTS